MMILRSFLIGSMIALLFAGNVGVDVYKHICKEDGVEVSFLINTNDHCEENDKHQEEKCCHEDEKKDNCCDDEVSYFQIKLDFFESYNPYILYVDGIVPVEMAWVEPSLIINRMWYNVDYTAPPPPTNSQRQSNLQVYII